MLLNSTRGFPIFADDATSLGTGLAGLTITVSLRKNGGSQNAVSPTITDLGDGVYWIEPIAAHRDTLGFNVWKFSASGAVIAPAFEEVVAVDNQVAVQPVNVTQFNGSGTPVSTLVLFAAALDQATGQIDAGTLADNSLTAAALAADAVAEIQNGLATAANQVVIIDGIGFVLAQEVGSVADAQTAAAVYVRSFNGSTYTITHTGLTSAGVRGTASLVKS